jgi:hypothetical protein
MSKRVIALVAGVLLLAGCKVDGDITITLDEDGTGTITTVVTLDAEAVGRVETNGRTLETAFPLDDLRTAGWEIAPWQRGPDGSAQLKLQHDYAGQEELQQRIGELVGPTGLLGDPRLRHDRGLLRSHDEVALAVDLRQPSTGIQKDPKLVAALQGSGVDVATLDQQLQAQLRESLMLSVTLVAPGGKEETVEVLPGERQTVTAARSRFESARFTWFAIAAMLVFLGLLLYLAASVGARHERKRGPAREPERTPLM